MSRYFTADLHLGHVNIIQYENRPYADVDEMNEGIIRRWNAQVRPEDHVLIVGDLVMGRVIESLELVHRLNGHKALLCGNHDRPWAGQGAKQVWAMRYMDAGIEQLSVGAKELPTYCQVVGDDGDGGEAVYDVLVNHFPFDTIDRHGDRFAGWAPRYDGQWLIHGHVHSAWRQRGSQINVGLDAWGGRLVTDQELHTMIEAGPQDREAIPWS